ncbi:MAG: type VII secretion protein EssC [Lachnospiraceae bacterium]|nr:type VII secretion protein EssC [Lachnospiraceae bacterium]
MSIVLSVYSRKAFQEFLLPALNNADYSINLEKDYFELDEDVILKLEVIEEQWKIKSDFHYQVLKEKQDYTGNILKDQDVLMVTTGTNEKFSLIVKEISSVFHSYDKYTLNDVEKIQIGKGEDNDIVYNYLNMVSKEHAVMEKRQDGWWMKNESPNGTYVNAVRIVTECKLAFGDYINILGLHMLFLGDILAVDTKEKEIRIKEDQLKVHENTSQNTVFLTERKEKAKGKTLYHRAPRNYEKMEEAAIEIEAPPEQMKQKEQSLMMAVGPSVTMALPMLLGCMMMVYASSASGGGSSLYMYSGLVMSVSSALIGVIWALANIRIQRKEEQEKEAHRFEAYSKYLLEKTELIKEKYNNTTEKLKEIYPDTEECLDYDETGSLLWNRNRNHEDFLTHRLGIGDIPFQVNIDIPKKRFRLYEDELTQKPDFIKENYEKLYQVPVTLDFTEHNLIGVVGGDHKAGAYRIAQIMSGQMAANNCYTDVKLGFLYDGASMAERENFAFAKWLPHTWSVDKKTRYIADNKEDASEVLFELTRIFRTRSEEKAEHRNQKDEIPKPYFVIFISDPTLLEGELFSKYAFDKEEQYGLTTVLLAKRYEELPNNCEFILQMDENFTGMYDVYDREEEKIRIDFDEVPAEKLKDFSRKISGIQVMELEEGGEIPSAITFFEMLDVKKPEELPVEDLWRKNRIYENIKGMLGQKAGGVPCYLDVHEKYHGPHGLVAGTTGSGKSETLQTYMLSLAVNYSPDDIGFFVIDYKGGGMANLFDGLPHMIGQISNLSGNQVKRAMISIKSENRRRQRVFNENDVNNINAYTKLYKSGEASMPIPHLFIIIDEFAELKREEPDFMKELISVAQVGRSLGVHLILATQKPSGTVDDNIQSNSKFRLCLRVQDKQDSNDMLGKPDAAFITQAGRGYLQVGNDEIYELFQSGYSGAVYDKDADTSQTDIARMLRLNGKVEMTGTMIKTMKKKKEKEKENLPKGKETTQLEAVKEYLFEVAEKNGYAHQHQLWMPVLPEALYLDSFEEYTESAFSRTGWKEQEGDWSLEFVLGKVDDPENQNQMPLLLDFARDGHIAVCGTIVSGKSTLMQTMIYAMIQKYTPQAVNIYGLDFSSKLMTAFEEAPQVGGIMDENDLDKISKFFNMIDGILKDRKALFRGGNYSQYVRVNKNALPAILIFIDNYAAFKEKTEEAYEEIMIRLSKEGVSCGIFLIISGAGFGLNEITQRVGENMNTVLCLALPDRFAYGDLLHSMQFDVLPESGVKGRGLTTVDGRILEYQTALSLEAENDYQRMELMKEQCHEMSEAWEGKKARKIPEIPKKPVWSLFEENDDFEKLATSRYYLPIGYNSANADIYGIPLADTYCYLIWGTKRSGKTNLLKVCLQSALKKEGQICVIDSPEGLLRNYEKEEKVRYVSTEDDMFEYFKELLPEFKRRNQLKQQLLQKDYEDLEIFEEMSKEEPIFIFISDLSWFVPFIYQAEKDMKGFLENIISKGRLHNIYFISELSLEKRELAAGYAIYESFAGHKTGIHLGGKVMDNPVLSFDYMPYLEQGKSEKPGIGQIPDAGDEKAVKKVVIPLARR